MFTTAERERASAPENNQRTTRGIHRARIRRAPRFVDLEWTAIPDYHLEMILEKHPDVQRLSPSEKLLLVNELWDDLAAHPADVPVTREQIAELDRRMETYRKDPTQVTTWEAIKTRILRSHSGSL